MTARKKRRIPAAPEWEEISAVRIDLQWFASAEDEGRTEDPSEHKLRKAREEGRVAKSMEAGGAAVLLAPVVVLAFSAPSMLSTIAEMTRFFLSRAAGAGDPDFTLFRAFVHYFVRLVTPVAVSAVLAALAANLIQTRGFVFSMKPLTPQFDKILPRFGQIFHNQVDFVDCLVRSCHQNM